MYIDQNIYNVILSTMPIICVDILVVNKYGKILLIKRNELPAKNQWWLPGGRLFKNEELTDCAKRKAKEEIGLDDCDVGPIVMSASTKFNDGPQGINVHSVNFVYLVIANEPFNVKLDETSSEYGWFREPPMDCHSYVKNAFRGYNQSRFQMDFFNE